MSFFKDNLLKYSGALGYDQNTDGETKPPLTNLKGIDPDKSNPFSDSVSSVVGAIGHDNPGSLPSNIKGGPVETNKNIETGASLPTLELPGLKLSEGSSVTNQLNKLNSKDSLANQQARVAANEYGVASGGVHSSQQGGAAQRAVSDTNADLAVSEANRSLSKDMADWQNKTTQASETYKMEYAERLSTLGYDKQTEGLMLQASTSLSNSLMQSITSLTNNTDLDFSQNLLDRFTTIFNTAMDNNNTILDLGFTY